MLFLLSTLALFVTAANGEVCETISFHLTKNETCKSHAIVLNPSHFVQFSNNTCLFFKVCGKFSSTSNSMGSHTAVDTSVSLEKRMGTYKMKKTKTSMTIVRRTFVWQCPSYEKLPVEKEILLLRTHVTSKVSPYYLLQKGPTSSVHLSTGDADANRTLTFKSPLLDPTAYPLNLKKVRVVLLDKNGKEAASMGFTFKPSDSLVQGQWFAKNRLFSAYPWSYRRMRGLRYNYFSIKGFSNVRATRRFYVNLRFGGCPGDIGFFAVFERPHCSYAKKQKTIPAYVYTRSRFGNREEKWSRTTIATSEFRIYGVLKNDRQAVSVRKSVGC